MHLLCLFGRGSLARADGPHGFVGNDCVVDGIAVEVEQTFFELFLHHIEMATRFTFLKHFANAINRRHIVLNQPINLFGKDIIGLAEIFPALAVTDDAVVHVDGFQHLGRNLARVGTLVVGTAILCAHVKALFVKLIVRQHLKIRERRADDHFAVQLVLLVKAVKDVVDQCFGLIESEVHFPVSCYDFASHKIIYFRFKI